MEVDPRQKTWKGQTNQYSSSCFLIRGLIYCLICKLDKAGRKNWVCLHTKWTFVLPGRREGEERTGEREIISTNHSRDVLSGIIKPFADWSARRLVKNVFSVNII